MSPLELLATGYGSIAFILAWCVVSAREGHERPGIGFRYGPEPRDDELRRLANRDGRAPVSVRLHSQPNTPKGQRQHGY